MIRPDKPHVDFDGHLDRPLRDMTPEQRLEWAWAAMVLRHQAEASGLRPKRDPDDPRHQIHFRSDDAALTTSRE